MAPLSVGRQIAAALLLLTATPIASAADGTLHAGASLAGPFGYAYPGVSAQQSQVELALIIADAESTHTLTLTTFDIDYADEVAVSLNGEPLDYLQTTANNQHGSSTLQLPAARLIEGSNALQFQQRVHGWTWGIAELSLETAPSDDDLPAEADITLQIGTPETARYGWHWSGAEAHRDEVTAEFAGTAADLTLSLLGYDVDFADEVNVLLNGSSLGFLSPGPNNALTSPHLVSIPAGAQLDGNNTLSFRQARASGYRWGVTDILLAVDNTPSGSDMMLSTGVIETGTFGWGWPGAESHRDVVTADFAASGTDLELTLRGYDVDFSDEVEVLLNGASLGYLSTGPNDRLTDMSHFRIAASEQRQGSNTLEFRQARASGYKWGITDILLMPPATDTVPETAPETDITLAIGVTEHGRYGWHWPDALARRDRVTASFNGSASDLQLSLAGYDIDFVDEVRVLLNGSELAYLGIGANNGLNSGDTLRIAAEDQLDGQNVLTFEQARVSGYKWGVTDLQLALAAPAPAPPTLPDLSGYELVFSDEFQGSQLDPDTWNTGLLWGPYQPINAEQQLYVDTLGIHAGYTGHDPFILTGDTLVIEAVPTTEQHTPPIRPDASDPIWNAYPEYRFNGGAGTDPGYQASDVHYLSGIITSYDSFRMTHGYVEIRARLPAGRGLWPAFWLLNTHYVADSPEIDVMEFLGQDTDTLYQTYHYFDTANGWAQISTPSMPVHSSDWTETFHTFGMAWGPRSIRWFVDGQETHRITDAEYRISGQAMYLLANLAVGGSWPGSPDASTPFPARYEIDYIRAYQRKPAEPLDLAADYQLMFADEFDGTTLNAANWDTHHLWGPFLPIGDALHYHVDALGIDSGASYTPFSLQNGVLAIEATHTASGSDVPPAVLPSPTDPIWADNPTFATNEHYIQPQYTAGMLSARDRFSFSHGYAEMRVRFPAATGLSTTFALMNSYYIGQQPTIDIAGFRGGEPGDIEHGYARFGAGGVPVRDAFTTSLPPDGESWLDNWHTVGVQWSGSELHWYLDGTRVHSYAGNDVPYQLMYPVISLGVKNAVELTHAAERTALIDYIRVYQIKP